VSRTDKDKRHGPQREGKPAKQEQESGAPPSRSPDEGPPVVLIVEDEEPIAEALAYLVEDCGYVALRAGNGKEALDLARLNHPRIVITDLMMPIMSGRELIAALRDDAVADGHAPPVIILTTAGGFSYARDTGADVVLRKPFDISEIESLLARYLGSADESQ
jgi:two-component system, OmpR family, response regulator VicR